MTLSIHAGCSNLFPTVFFFCLPCSLLKYLLHAFDRFLKVSSHSTASRTLNLLSANVRLKLIYDYKYQHEGLLCFFLIKSAVQSHLLNSTVVFPFSTNFGILSEIAMHLSAPFNPFPALVLQPFILSECLSNNISTAIHRVMSVAVAHKTLHS
jgi:hypothetical protein